MWWPQEPPEPRALLGFYCRTRPPGLWAPVRAAVPDQAALAAADAARARDLLATVAAPLWQVGHCAMAQAGYHAESPYIR